MSTAAERAAELVAWRREGLRRFRLVEIVALAVVLAGAFVLLLRVPAGADEYTDEVSAAIVGAMVLLGLQWALVGRLWFRVVTGPARRRARREQPFRGGILTALSPVLVVLVALPWILRGAFGQPPGENAFGLFLVLVLAAGLGLLAVPAVVAPVELAVRGTVLLVTRSDREGRARGWGYLKGAFWLGALTTFVLVVALGANFGGTGRASWGSIVLAMLGVPVGYEVVHPVLLWVGRLMLYGFALSLLVPWVRRRLARRRARTR